MQTNKKVLVLAVVFFVFVVGMLLGQSTLGQLANNQEVLKSQTAQVVSSTDDSTNSTMCTATDYVYIDQWGTTGSGNGQFKSPVSIAVNSYGDAYYVVDASNNRIQKFDAQGNFILSWGGSGIADGKFKNPTGVAVDFQGNVYVADSGNSRVQKFTSSGTFILKWTSAVEGIPFKGLAGIAVDRNTSHVYVVDSAAYRVYKYTSTGSYVSQFGDYGNGNGLFRGAYDAAVDANGNVYVTDIFLNRIQKFNSSGVYVSKWGTAGTGNGQFNKPYGIGVEYPTGDVFVADTINHRIQKFDSAGNFITKFGSLGANNAQFNAPKDVVPAVLPAPDRHRVYVADTGNNRIQYFGFKCGTIIIEKLVTPFPDPNGFRFMNNINPIGGFWLDDNNDPVLSNTAVFPLNTSSGSYQVSEIITHPEYATSVSCVDPTNDSTTSGATANINVSNSETVICTFRNDLINP